MCGGGSTASKEAKSPSKRGEGVQVTPIFLHISISWVEMSFHVEFHLPGLLWSALKVFGGGILWRLYCDVMEAIL